MKPSLPPEEDSTDLSDQEIQSALPTSGVSDIVTALRSTPCSTCGLMTQIAKHSIRRRLPHLYWRVDLVCRNEHSTKKTFCADWIKGGES